MLRFDIQQLKIFVTVAQEEHLTRAAEKMHISLSAASSQIRNLEVALETKLFDRSNRSLILTEAGKILLAQANKILEESKVFTSLARDLKKKPEGCIVIGESSHNSYPQIGSIIKSINLMNPLIKFQIKAKTSTSVLESIKSGDIDIGYAVGNFVDPHFIYYPIDEVHYCIVAPVAFHSIIEGSDLHAISRLPWISPLPSASKIYTNILYDVFYEKGLQLNTLTFFDSAVLGESLFSRGIGLMLMEAKKAQSLVAKGQAVLYDMPLPYVKKHMVHLRSRSDDPLLKTYVEVALQLRGLGT